MTKRKTDGEKKPRKSRAKGAPTGSVADPSSEGAVAAPIPEPTPSSSAEKGHGYSTGKTE